MTWYKFLKDHKLGVNNIKKGSVKILTSKKAKELIKDKIIEVVKPKK